MSTFPSAPRFLLFPQVAPAEPEVERPAVRRYSLARIDASAKLGDADRFAYLKQGHD
jgi:hypothetical protein